MVHGVASVWLPVKDMDRALKFYGDTLDLEQGKAQDDWAEIDANGLKIGLNASEAEGARADGGAVVAFQPEGGIDDAVSELKGKGIEVPGEISEHPWGRIATFKDSEGNDLQLYEPPNG